MNRTSAIYDALVSLLTDSRDGESFTVKQITESLLYTLDLDIGVNESRVRRAISMLPAECVTRRGGRLHVSARQGVRYDEFNRAIESALADRGRLDRTMSLFSAVAAEVGSRLVMGARWVTVQLDHMHKAGVLAFELNYGFHGVSIRTLAGGGGGGEYAPVGGVEEQIEVVTLDRMIDNDKERFKADKELGDHLNVGWEIVNLTVLGGDGWTQRVVTLKRVIRTGGGLNDKQLLERFLSEQTEPGNGLPISARDLADEFNAWLAVLSRGFVPIHIFGRLMCDCGYKPMRMSDGQLHYDRALKRGGGGGGDYALEEQPSMGGRQQVCPACGAIMSESGCDACAAYTLELMGVIVGGGGGGGWSATARQRYTDGFRLARQSRTPSWQDSCSGILKQYITDPVVLAGITSFTNRPRWIDLYMNQRPYVWLSADRASRWAEHFNLIAAWLDDGIPFDHGYGGGGFLPDDLLTEHEAMRLHAAMECLVMRPVELLPRDDQHVLLEIGGFLMKPNHSNKTQALAACDRFFDTWAEALTPNGGGGGADESCPADLSAFLHYWRIEDETRAFNMWLIDLNSVDWLRFSLRAAARCAGGGGFDPAEYSAGGGGGGDDDFAFPNTYDSSWDRFDELLACPHCGYIPTPQDPDDFCGESGLICPECGKCVEKEEWVKVGGGGGSDTTFADVYPCPKCGEPSHFGEDGFYHCACGETFGFLPFSMDSEIAQTGIYAPLSDEIDTPIYGMPPIFHDECPNCYAGGYDASKGCMFCNHGGYYSTGGGGGGVPESSGAKLSSEQGCMLVFVAGLIAAAVFVYAFFIFFLPLAHYAEKEFWAWVYFIFAEGAALGGLNAWSQLKRIKTAGGDHPRVNEYGLKLVDKTCPECGSGYVRYMGNIDGGFHTYGCDDCPAMWTEYKTMRGGGGGGDYAPRSIIYRPGTPQQYRITQQDGGIVVEYGTFGANDSADHTIILRACFTAEDHPSAARVFEDAHAVNFPAIDRLIFHMHFPQFRTMQNTGSHVPKWDSFHYRIGADDRGVLIVQIARGAVARIEKSKYFSVCEYPSAARAFDGDSVNSRVIDYLIFRWKKELKDAVEAAKPTGGGGGGVYAPTYTITEALARLTKADDALYAAESAGGMTTFQRIKLESDLRIAMQFYRQALGLGVVR